MENSNDIQTQTESEHDPNAIAKDNTSVRGKPRRWIIFAVLCALSLAALGIGSFYGKQPVTKSVGDTETEMIQELPASTFQDTELFFQTTEPVGNGSKQSFPIWIRTGTNTVSAVEMHLRYDPTYVTDVSIATGTFLPNPTILAQQINTDEGTVLFTLGTLSPRQGEGVIATLNITALSDESRITPIEFDPDTRVAGLEEEGDVLKGTTGLTVSIRP